MSGMEYKVNIHSSFHHQSFEDEKEPDKIMPKLEIEVPKPHVQRGEEILNILKICFFLLIGILFSLAVFSWYTWKHTNSKVMIGIMGTSLVAIVGCILGIIGSFKSIQEHHQIYAANIRREYGHDIMMISLYFLVADFILFSVLGTFALLSTQQSLDFLQNLYDNDKEGWKLMYGDKEIDEVKEWAILMIHIVSYTCYIIVVLIVLISFFKYKFRENFKDAPIIH
ncbi:unnamed protein product [Blepharisma stoltei]|uniref:Transmembrane protein n=1 Tax=Blepharisma stoltei TaxID=1481888 RepID=A0AAU9I495_9CILI|nr:unnamed protein product [Blepharisma stoltei]